MKKMCVSIVIVYVIMMAFMAESVLAQDILNITPVIVGVIFIIYAGILMLRESKLLSDINEKKLNKEIEEYKIKLDALFEEINQMKKKTANLRHDFVNHAQVLAELVDKEKCPNRDELLEEIREELIDKTKISYSDNEIVNLALELNLSELKGKGYNIQEDIKLFGLKDIEAYNFCYNIWLLIEVLMNQVKKETDISLKLYVKDRMTDKIRIAYKLEGYVTNMKRITARNSYEYKMFKELMDITGGIVIDDVKNGKLVLAGWMEVQKNV